MVVNYNHTSLHFPLPNRNLVSFVSQCKQTVITFHRRNCAFSIVSMATNVWYTTAIGAYLSYERVGPRDLYGGLGRRSSRFPATAVVQLLDDKDYVHSAPLVF